ncbi:NlpC/P60 family protein [Melissospora conviva]|uniref:C40 family peptidase n=1 Tax=Melissospora conviva TaxID=3388432 RepID=UPI003C1EC21F
MDHQSTRPPSSRPARADRISVSPRNRWSRFITVSAALVAASAVALGAPGAAQAEPSIPEIERRLDKDWHKLEPLIEEHNAVRQELATKRRQADALARRLEPLEKRLAESTGLVGALAAEAYKGHNRTTALNAILTRSSPEDLVGQLEILDSLALQQRNEVAEVLDRRDELAAKKAPLDALITDLTATERRLAAERKEIDSEIDRLEKQRRSLYGARGHTGNDGGLRPEPCPVAYSGGVAAKVVTFACAQIGKPYVWASAGPGSYDCSGLMLAAWRKAGVSLPHNARQQRGTTRSVERADLRPGDLVFYYGDLHHVAMYVGGGWVVHAPQAGDSVRMARYDMMPIHSFGRPRT